MNNAVFNDKKKLFRWFVISIWLLAFCSVLSCTNDGPEDDPGTGSISFDIVWPEISNDQPQALMSAVDCNALGISTIVCNVYNGTETTANFLKGETWQCSAHSGTVMSVTAGSNRRVVVTAKDSSGGSIYKGEISRVTVTAGQTIKAGTVTMSSLIEEDPDDVDDDGDGYTENEGDCNDSNADINPGESEICGDGIDQDCDGEDEACVPNQAPVVEITSPQSNATFNKGDVIAFSSRATDAEDGEISHTEFVWGSDIDGIINLGNKSFSTGALSAGTHTITLTVTDSFGTTNSDEILVSISLLYPANFNIISSGTTQPLYSVWGISSNQVFASTPSTILFYDGNTWSDFKMPEDHNDGIWGIWATSISDLYSISNLNLICHYNGSNWSCEWMGGCTSYLNDIWGLNSSDIYAVGRGDNKTEYSRITHFDGDNWTEMTVNTDQVMLNCVWGSSNNNIFTVGQSGVIIQYNGNTWQQMNSPINNDLFGIWGTSDSNIFAVGASGTILFYDGVSWKKIDSGTVEDLYAIWCISDSQIYAVGDSGTILYWNDIVWDVLDVGVNNKLNDIWVSSESDIFIVGDDGLVLQSK